MLLCIYNKHSYFSSLQGQHYPPQLFIGLAVWPLPLGRDAVFDFGSNCAPMAGSVALSLLV